MRLYYIAQAEGSRHYVRSALGVDVERWNGLFQEVHRWRRDLSRNCGIALDRELHFCDLLAEVGMPAGNGGGYERLSPTELADAALDGLCRLEDAARTLCGIDVINVCLPKTNGRPCEQVSLERLLNRFNRSVGSAGRHAFLIFDEGDETMITRAYRRLRVFNPVPSMYELWEEGERTRNIPMENVIGGPAFRTSAGDILLQMASLIAHTLLIQEEGPAPTVEGPGMHEVFSILDCALNRRASRRDLQGIVRR